MQYLAGEKYVFPLFYKFTLEREKAVQCGGAEAVIAAEGGKPPGGAEKKSKKQHGWKNRYFVNSESY